MNAVELKNVSKCIGKDFVLENITFSLEEGMVLGIIGYNGSGKSSLLETIIGTSSIDEGEISIFGEKFTETMRNDIGIVISKNYGMFEIFNVDEINELLKDCFASWDSEVFYDYIKRFNISKNKPYIQLSTGLRKKVDLAIALSHNAKLLVLDEPTSAADTKSKAEILEMLNEYRADNHTVIVVTNFLDELSRICDYVAVLNNGKLSIFEQLDSLTDKYCTVFTTTEKFKEIDKSGILYQKFIGQLSVEAVVERAKIPKDLCDIQAISIDELAIHLM